MNLSLVWDLHSSIWQIAYDPKQTCKPIYLAKFDIFLSSIIKYICSLSLWTISFALSWDWYMYREKARKVDRAMRIEQFPLTTARTNLNSLNGKSNKNKAKKKHLCLKNYSFTSACPSRVLKRSQIKTVLLSTRFILASRKQFTALRLNIIFNVDSPIKISFRPNNATFPHFTQKPEVNDPHALLQKL